MPKVILFALALLALGACKTTEAEQPEGGYAPGARPVYYGTFMQPFLKLP